MCESDDDRDAAPTTLLPSGEVITGETLITLPDGTRVNIFPDGGTVSLTDAAGEEFWAGSAQHAQVLALALWAGGTSAGSDDVDGHLVLGHAQLWAVARAESDAPHVTPDDLDDRLRPTAEGLCIGEPAELVYPHSGN
jgi:hypothetical protein